MNRTAPTKFGAFLFLHRRMGAHQNRSSSFAMALAAAAALLVASSASAFQYPKYLKYTQPAKAPIAARNLCGTYAWACSSSAGSGVVSPQHYKAVKEVNRLVNRQVREVSDYRQFQTGDYWTLPTSRGGDCEDFALLKKQELIKRGLPAQSLLIATVLDKSNQGHAVLVVRTTQGDLILDNLTGQIRSWSQTGYTFLRMQNPDAPNRWVSLAMAN